MFGFASLKLDPVSRDIVYIPELIVSVENVRE
jgi:hypothetical protein